MEKNKKPISIDFDALESDLEKADESNSGLEMQHQNVEKEKPKRIYKKKEKPIDQKITTAFAEDVKENNDIEESKKIAEFIEKLEMQKDKQSKRSPNEKLTTHAPENQELEVEFWKDQNASCYLTFKPGVERQIIKRVKNRVISYTIEYNFD